MASRRAAGLTPAEASSLSSSDVAQVLGDSGAVFDKGITLHHRPLAILETPGDKPAPLDLERGADPGTASPRPGGDDDEGAGPGQPGGLPGWAWLLLVAVLWGTYSPALRYIYSQPGPPHPSVLLFIRTVIGAITLGLVDRVIQRRGKKGGESLHSQTFADIKPQPAGPPLRRLMNSTFGAVWMGGLELGFFKFLGEAFQAVGLERTSAIRGAFLIQATSLLTPFLATLGGERLTGRVLAGAGLALAGTSLLTLTQHAPASTVAVGSIMDFLPSGGDAAVLTAALFYSLSTVRLSKYAEIFPPVRLATWKTLASALVATAWLATDAAGTLSSGQPLASMWVGAWDSPAAWVATAWLALGPGALATYAQLRGQSLVPASQAQVLYSTVPVWSAILALAFLTGETAGPAEWVGGGAIIAAGLLAAQGSAQGDKARHGGGSGGGKTS